MQTLATVSLATLLRDTKGVNLVREENITYTRSDFSMWQEDRLRIIEDPASMFAN